MNSNVMALAMQKQFKVLAVFNSCETDIPFELDDSVKRSCIVNAANKTEAARLAIVNGKIPLAVGIGMHHDTRVQTLAELPQVDEVYWEPYYGLPDIVASDISKDSDMVVVGIPRLAELLFLRVDECQ